MATRRNRPPLGEIGIARGGLPGAQIYAQALWPVPPSDPVLLQAGGWRGYEELLRDDQVAATFAQRRLAVVRRPVVVEPGGERRADRRAADLVRETLDRIEFDRVTDQMLYARLFGWAVAELIWATSGGTFYLDALRVRDRQHFTFAANGQLLVRTDARPTGEIAPPNKFWTISVGASHHDEPYGRGLGHQLYWPVYFKRNGARFWAIFLEKFGAPTVVGRLPPGSDDDTRRRLLDAIEAIQTDAGVTIPEGVAIELLEASRGGTATYPEWMGYWDRAIAKTILGQTMTTDEGSSRAQAQVHFDVRADLIAADADLICESANRTWVRWLVDLTFPGAAYPRIFREMEEPEDLLQRAQRDQILYGLGIKLTADAVARVYGDDYELVEPTAPPPDENPPELPTGDETEPVEAAERTETRREPVEVLADLAAEAVQPHVDRWTETVAALADRATSLEELHGLIVEAYGWLPRAELVAALRAATLAGVAAGWIDAEADARAR